MECLLTVVYYCSEFLFSVKGVPYNVTVFATNERGKGPSVRVESYAEEDGE